MGNRNGTDIAACLAAVVEFWSPQVVGKVNDQYIKIAKLKGELAWHAHENEDELFIVVHGRLVIEIPGVCVTLQPGQFYVVPRGTPHNPKADEETGIVLIESVTTLHTGNVHTPRTKSLDDQLAGNLSGFRER